MPTPLPQMPEACDLASKTVPSEVYVGVYRDSVAACRASDCFGLIASKKGHLEGLGLGRA